MKYPFLPQAREQISKAGLDLGSLAEIPPITNRAKERVLLSFDLALRLIVKPNKDEQTELPSFPLAIFYVAAIKDKKLFERFALFEAQTINTNLQKEKRPDVIIEIARSFNWNLTFTDDASSGAIHVPFAKFLENTAKGRLMHDLKWKLINRKLDQGLISITPNELARLLQEEVKNRIQERIERISEDKALPVPELMKGDIEEIRLAFNKVKPNLEEFDKIVKAQESEYPPCITEFLKRAATGQHLSHVERFTLVTYLIHQGISIDAIVAMFSNVSDFNESKTRYQVENLAGKTSGRSEPYTTYNCDTLQTHGVCKKASDPVCRRIRNPLRYHLVKQWIEGKDKEKR
jgi:DNA primase large subunit